MGTKDDINAIVDEAIAAGKADYVTVPDLLRLITDLAASGKKQAEQISQLSVLVRDMAENLLKVAKHNVRLQSRIEHLEVKAREHDSLH